MKRFDHDILVSSTDQFIREMNEVCNSSLQLSNIELEQRCSQILQQFSSGIETLLRVTVRFADIHWFHERMHSELCLIELDASRAIFTFPERNLTHQQNSRGLVFVKRAVAIVPILDILANKLGVGRIQFLFEVGDNGYLDAVSFCSKNNYSCLIPDCDFFATDGYASFRALSCENFVVWETRESKVFWRGSSTGIRDYSPPTAGEPDNLRWLQRLNLCVQGQSDGIKEYCDFGISSIVNIHEPYLVDRIVAANIMRPPVPKAKFLEFKGVIDVDGNSNAWSGLFCGLLTGACVIKIGSTKDFRQWYYRDLLPWHNYLPVAPDLPDLTDAIYWLVHHDELAKEIGRKGRELALSITLDTALERAADDVANWIKRSHSVRFL